MLNWPKIVGQEVPPLLDIRVAGIQLTTLFVKSDVLRQLQVSTGNLKKEDAKGQASAGLLAANGI